MRREIRSVIYLECTSGKLYLNSLIRDFKTKGFIEKGDSETSV